MISLDEKIIDQNSSVAQRMIEYGKTEPVFILIPSAKKMELKLSEQVHVFCSGGNKIQQFFRLVYLGKKICKDNVISLITTQDPFFTALAGFFIQKKSKSKLEIQVHGDFFGSDFYSHEFAKQLIGRFILRRVDFVRVVGERIKQSLIQLGIPEQKITVRPVQQNMHLNASPNFSLREKYPNFQKIFLCMGRMEPVKNGVFLISVFEQVLKSNPGFVLLFVGEGSKKDEWIQEVQTRNLEKNIIFEPWTNSVLEYMKTADALLFPSLSEGYGLVVMEAASVGLPVIMNDVGVANYELHASEKVKIIPVDEKENWVEAIRNI